MAAAAFLVTCVLTNLGLRSWVEPWSSTPIAPLALGTLLALLRLADRPSPPRGFLAGLLCGAILLIRPTEAMAVGLPGGVFALALLARLPARRAAGIAAMGALGTFLALTLAVALHLAIFGWSLGPTCANPCRSASNGACWASAGSRWWSRPARCNPDRAGDGACFPVGAAGLRRADRLRARRRARRPAHLLIAGAVGLHWACFLAYRDLHPEGLWQCRKLSLLQVDRAVARPHAILLAYIAWRHRAAAATGVVVVLLACCWRAEAVPLSPAAQDAQRTGAGAIILVPSGLSTCARWSWSPSNTRPCRFILARTTFQAGGVAYVYNSGFKAYPLPGGLMIAPLRPLHPGPVRIERRPRRRSQRAPRPILARRRLVSPCRAACSRTQRPVSRCTHERRSMFICLTSITPGREMLQSMIRWRWIGPCDFIGSGDST